MVEERERSEWDGVEGWRGNGAIIFQFSGYITHIINLSLFLHSYVLYYYNYHHYHYEHLFYPISILLITIISSINIINVSITTHIYGIKIKVPLLVNYMSLAQVTREVRKSPGSCQQISLYFSIEKQ